MKFKIGVLVFVLLVCVLSFSFSVRADLDFEDVEIEKEYSAYEFISGKGNLSVFEEEVDGVFSSNLDGEISLIDFLEANGYSDEFECVPSDCSSRYEFSGDEVEKSFSLDSFEKYGGFVVFGDNVDVTGLSFNLSSDFSNSKDVPLKIEFFEDVEFEFEEFSEEFSERDYGCYASSKKVEGPLIRTSKYCEAINLSRADAVRVGAEVSDEDDKDLRMTLYDDFSSLGECEFNPSLEEDCLIEAEVYEGEHFVCVDSFEETNYHLYSESYGEKCGFVYSDYSSGYSKDYAIFARTSLYANSSFLEFEESFFDELVESADDFVKDKYGRDCSEGCVLPIKFEGVEQEIVLKDLVLDYRDDFEDKNPLSKIYDLEKSSALVDFEGAVDFEFFEFLVENGVDEFVLYFEGDEIFEKDIEVLDAPFVKNIYPNVVPAGVETQFQAILNFSLNESLDYEWDFGDEVLESSTNFVNYTFNETGNFSLSVKVSAGENRESERTFELEVISPEEAVNYFLVTKRKNLNSVLQDINSYPSWYREILKEKVRYEEYDSELSRLERMNESAVDEEDFIEIALDLGKVDEPEAVYVGNSFSGPLITDVDSINPSVIETFVGGSSVENLDEYKKAILRWQDENVMADLVLKEFFVSSSFGSEKILKVYSFDVTSLYGDESYFVIQEDFGEVFFKEDLARKVDDATLIVFDESEQKDFEFYLTSIDETNFFMSPSLNALVLEDNIDENCNRNGVCEEDLGETTENCPTDCKRLLSPLLWVLLILFLGLVAYTFAQMWYKTRYEKYLFGDRRELFNLVMFITNARARGMDDNKIFEELKKQKWSSEQIVYALKKSKGERTGMYEIIPVEKVFAFFRRKKVQKGIATGSEEQNWQNINKLKMRGNFNGNQNY